MTNVDLYTGPCCNSHIPLSVVSMASNHSEAGKQCKLWDSRAGDSQLDRAVWWLVTMQTCLYQAVYVWGKSASYPDTNYFSHKKCSFLIRNNCHSLATQRRLCKRQKRIYSCTTQNISSNSFQMYLNILLHLRSSSWSKLCIVISQTHPLGPRHDQPKYI